MNFVSPHYLYKNEVIQLSNLIAVRYNIACEGRKKYDKYGFANSFECFEKR